LLFPPSLVGCAPRCCRDCWKLCIATFHEDSVMWRYLNPDWYFCPANESDRRRFRRWVFDHPRLCWQRSKPAYQPSPIDLPQSLPDMFLNPALHLHCVCAKLFLSFIGHASFYDEIWWSGNQPYLTMKRGFFYPTLEALWNPRHSQGFSNTINKRELIKIMTSSLISNPIIFGLDLISFGISYFIRSQPPFFDFHLFRLLYFPFKLIHFLSHIISRIMCS